jgi:hypothetical protein
LAIYPVDVIKSAMATDAIEPSKRKYPNMATTYKVGRMAHTVMSIACVCDHAPGFGTVSRAGQPFSCLHNAIALHVS